MSNLIATSAANKTGSGESILFSLTVYGCLLIAVYLFNSMPALTYVYLIYGCQAYTWVSPKGQACTRVVSLHGQTAIFSFTLGWVWYTNIEISVQPTTQFRVAVDPIFPDPIKEKKVV